MSRIHISFREKDGSQSAPVYEVVSPDFSVDGQIFEVIGEVTVDRIARDYSFVGKGAWIEEGYLSPEWWKHHEDFPPEPDQAKEHGTVPIPHSRLIHTRVLASLI